MWIAVRQKFHSWQTDPQRWNKLREGWFWQSIGLPFLATRLAAVVVMWFGRYYLPNPTYVRYTERGWVSSPHFLLDIWARWDALHYLSIIEQGYQPAADLSSQMSNVAFFPAYPYLVRLFTFLLPAGLVSRSVILVIGLALSNLLFLAALAMLYRLVRDRVYDEAAARRTVLLVILFPAGFYFSAFYTESLFLFLTLLAFTAALDRRWWLAGLSAGLLTVTRAQGILIVVPLAWLYLDSIRWRLRNLRLEALWLAFTPLPLAAHLAWLYTRTGDFFAPMTAQKAWGHQISNFRENVLGAFSYAGADVYKLNILFLGCFLLLGLWALLKIPNSRAYGLFALLLPAANLFTGNYLGMTRYLAVVFPAFIALAALLKPRELFWLAGVLFLCLQAAFWVGWVNLYWIA